MSAVLESITSKISTNGVKLRLTTTSEYDRMIETGIYTKNDVSNCLTGRLLKLRQKDQSIFILMEKIAVILKAKLKEKADVRSQNPIILDDFSEPEPDIVLAIPPRENYLENHPKPTDILLIMEISDRTLTYDREAKAAAYSRNGFQPYLLLNLQNEPSKITANQARTVANSIAPPEKAIR